MTGVVVPTTTTNGTTEVTGQDSTAPETWMQHYDPGFQPDNPEVCNGKIWEI